MTMTTSDCARFVAFRLDPSVCDFCGRLGDEHAPAARQTPEHMKALWRMMLKLGGTRDTYGDQESYGYNSGTVRDHMLTCGFKWSAMREPMMDWDSIFAGTFAENERIQRIQGRLFCQCGTVQYETWHIGHLTMGQLIWHAVREGDYPEGER